MARFWGRVTSYTLNEKLQRIDPNPCSPDHQIIMFYVEGDRLLGMHYCDGGNRARFDGKMSPDGMTSEFNLLDVAGSTKGWTSEAYGVHRS
jgi:hypothetical protein